MKTRTALQQAAERAVQAKRNCRAVAWGTGVLPMLRSGALFRIKDGHEKIWLLFRSITAYGNAESYLAAILAEQVEFAKRQMTPSQFRRFTQFVRAQLPAKPATTSDRH